MKKLFAFILALILIFSLCACNDSQLSGDENQQTQSSGTQQPQNNDTTSNTKYKLTVIDYWGYLAKPLNENYEAGDVVMVFLAGPAVGIEINGEYIEESLDMISDVLYHIITFTMPAKDSILYTTHNGHIGYSDKNEISEANSINYQSDRTKELLMEGFAPTEANQGDTVVLRTYPLMDAELAFYANGVKLTQTYADYDYWEYVFIMPNDDVVISHEITDGFLPD